MSVSNKFPVSWWYGRTISQNSSWTFAIWKAKGKTCHLSAKRCLRNASHSQANSENCVFEESKDMNDWILSVWKFQDHHQCLTYWGLVKESWLELGSHALSAPCCEVLGENKFWSVCRLTFTNGLIVYLALLFYGDQRAMILRFRSDILEWQTLCQRPMWYQDCYNQQYKFKYKKQKYL